MKHTPINLVGVRVGKITVLRRVERPSWFTKTGALWECICDCGNICYKQSGRFKEGKAKTCGKCNEHKMKEAKLANTRYPEGTRQTSEYSTWQGMIQRCTNPNNEGYHLYMGKGIKVCNRWMVKKKGFLNFLEDMGKKPTPQHTLDRIDSNGNYEPSNCRWTTWFVQLANTSRNHWVEYNGERLVVAEMARRLGIHEHTFHHHLKKGNSIEHMLKCKAETERKKLIKMKKTA